MSAKASTSAANINAEEWGCRAFVGLLHCLTLSCGVLPLWYCLEVKYSDLELCGN